MLKAKVTRVVDGDTVEVQATFKVRMDFIDAPETHGVEKESGLISRQWLVDTLPAGCLVDLDVKSFDMYGRALSVVYKDGANINGDMLKQHLAEVYTPKNHDDGIME